MLPLPNRPSLALLSVSVMLAVSGFSMNAEAQSYYSARAHIGDSVEVDLSALEKLGTPSTLPDLLRQGPIIIGKGSNVPEASHQTAPKSGLTSSAAPQPVPVPSPSNTSGQVSGAAPAPETTPQSGLASTSTTPEATAITPKKKPAPPPPSPTSVIEEVEQAATPEPEPAPEPAPAVEPEPAPEPAALAVSTEAPEPVPAPEPAATPEPASPPTPAPVPTPTPEPVAVDTAVSTETTGDTATEAFQPPPEEDGASDSAEATAEDEAAEDQAADEDEQTVAAVTTPVADPNVISVLDDGFSIKFPPERQDLPPGARTSLESLAAEMRDNETIRVKLVGYAAASGSSQSQPRRISLFRALAVRTFLLKQEVSSRRIDVHARGSKVPDGDADRVDVVVQK